MSCSASLSSATSTDAVDVASAPVATISAVSITSVPEVRVLSLRRTIDSFPAQGALWQQLCAYAAARNVSATGARFMVLHSAGCDNDASAASSIDIEVCIPIDSTTTTTATAATTSNDDVPIADTNDRVCERVVPQLVRAAVVTLVGPYSELANAHHTMRTWLAEQQVHAAGPTREVYRHQDYANDPAGQSFVTDVIVSLDS